MVIKYLCETYELRSENNNPLKWASENGHIEVVKYLWKHTS